MKGINNAEHKQLIGSLLQRENLLRIEFGEEADKQLATELRTELAAMHENYNKQLIALGELIEAYHELFKKVKTTFLSPKLRALRKKAEHDTKVRPLLKYHIRPIYRTNI